VCKELSKMRAPGSARMRALRRWWSEGARLDQKGWIARVTLGDRRSTGGVVVESSGARAEDVARSVG
jgi:hypothetical protein